VIKKDIDVIVEKAVENVEQMPNNISGGEALFKYFVCHR
jgi:hypothetical protein